MKSHLFTLLIATLLTLPLAIKGAHASTLPAADDPKARGLSIAKLSDETNLGYGDTKTELRMVLTNATDRLASGACGSTRSKTKTPQTATGT